MRTLLNITKKLTSYYKHYIQNTLVNQCNSLKIRDELLQENK